MVFIVLVISAGNFALNRKVSQQICELFIVSGEAKAGKFSHEGVDELPAPVQRYLRYSLNDGQGEIRSVRLKQEGFFRLKDDPDLQDDEAWLPVKANQYFNIEDPGFLWHAKVNMAPLLWFEGWDAYIDGKGSLRFKILSLVTAADARECRQMDEGELLRFLSESPWYPTALAGDNFQWEAMDDNSARVTLRDEGMEVDGVFNFDDAGRIIRLETMRYRLAGEGYSYEKWTGYYRDYQDMDGVMIPTDVEVVWNLEAGDLSYARLRVTDIEYNVPSEY